MISEDVNEPRMRSHLARRNTGQCHATEEKMFQEAGSKIAEFLR